MLRVLPRLPAPPQASALLQLLGRLALGRRPGPSSMSQASQSLIRLKASMGTPPDAVLGQWAGQLPHTRRRSLWRNPGC